MAVSINKNIGQPPYIYIYIYVERERVDHFIPISIQVGSLLGVIFHFFPPRRRVRKGQEKARPVPQAEMVEKLELGSALPPMKRHPAEADPSRRTDPINRCRRRLHHRALGAG